MNKWTSIVMDDGWVHPLAQNPTFSCQQFLMKMIEIWMKIHLVSDSNCSTVIYNTPDKLQGMINNIGLTFSVGDTTPRFTISIEQHN